METPLSIAALAVVFFVLASPTSAQSDLFVDFEGPDVPAPAGTPHAPDSSNVTLLNRFTFEGNVIQGNGRAVDHWAVLFCVDWFEPCMTMRTLFEDLASFYEEELNSDAILSSTVRFAYVDCAVDKPLCNTQDVDGYPSVVHYFEHGQTGLWGGTVEDMHRLKKENQLPNWLERQFSMKPGSSTSSKPSIFTEMMFAVGLRCDADTIAGCFVIALIIGGAGFMMAYDPLASSSATCALANEGLCADEKTIEHFVLDELPASASTTSHRFLPDEWIDDHGMIEL